MTKNYCIVNTETSPQYCENIVIWSGDTTTWNPPEGSIALIQDETPSLNWVFDATANSYVLSPSVGEGSIGWTWDGTNLITNEPEPVNPSPQPPNNTVETF